MSKTTTTTTPTDTSIIGAISWLLNRIAPNSTPLIPTTEAGAPLLVAGKAASTGQNILYLAYGSNLNRATFEGRRGIKPISATVVCVPALRLTFDLPGIAYLEPRFANVRLVTETPEAGEATAPLPQGYRDGQEDNDPEPPLVGVVYEITPTDFAAIIATEGGGATYQDVVVDCFPVSSSPSPSSAEPLRAHTLLAPSSRTRQGRAQASARYLGLIAAGAAQHDFPLSYRNHIARYRPYKTSSVRQRIGRALFAGLWLPTVFTVFGIARMAQGPGGHSPAWSAALGETLFTVMWWTYDRVFSHVFGDGESTVEEAAAEVMEVMEVKEEKEEKVKEEGKLQADLKSPRVEDMFMDVMTGGTVTL